MSPLNSADRESALQEENQELAFQLAKSFEELSLLRRLASSLVIGEQLDGSVEPFDDLMEELREVVLAEQVYLIQGHINSDDCEFIAAGQDLLNLDDVCEIVRELGTSQSRPLVHNRPLRHVNVHSMVMVRLSTGDREHGWLVACNHQTPEGTFGQGGFSSVEATLLMSAASIVAAYRRNLELLRQKGALFTDMVRALVNAVDARDPYTCGHSERVALYAKHLGAHVKLDAPACERIHLTGLLHDVGKIAVPDAVLRKCGRLSELEFNAIAQHPVMGYRMLKPLTALKAVLPGVLHHHESVDGTGYPDGLKGDEIPLDARLLAICDAYDAMTSDRPYRRGMPHAKAVEILQSGAGTQWDEELIEAFLQCQDEFERIGRDYVDNLELSREVFVEQPLDDTEPPYLNPIHNY